MPRNTKHRDSSPEIPLQQYTKQGRPVRRTAGKKEKVSGYVDSAIIDADDDEPLEVPSEDEDGEIIKYVRNKKRKRSPSPIPPPLDQVHYNEEPDAPSDDETKSVVRRTASDKPVHLTFNIPLGYHGPMTVKLTPGILHSAEGARHDMETRPASKKKTKALPPPQDAVTNAKSEGFGRLPPEIRNRVYELLFKDADEFKFHTPDNFCKSAQFLRTCKLVYSEGCSVLYSENKFVFDRNRHQRARYWEPIPKEIGYTDVRRFLKDIGPENLSYLRDVKIIFEDASPAATPYLPSHESRRYVNDQHLIDCLRILAQTKLQKFTINFHGRRALLKTDVRFLSYLEQIKADEVTSSEAPRWYNPNKISDSMFKELKEVMVRKKKMYPETK